jgi:hypothetical protein
MNITKTKLLLVAATLTTANLASAGNDQSFVATNNSIESKICMAAASASKMRMNSAVKQISPTKHMNTKYELVANKLQCNGINVADFAAKAGNIEVAKKLRSYRDTNVEIRDIASVYSGHVSIIGE